MLLCNSINILSWPHVLSHNVLLPAGACVLLPLLWYCCSHLFFYFYFFIYLLTADSHFTCQLFKNGTLIDVASSNGTRNQSILAIWLLMILETFKARLLLVEGSLSNSLSIYIFIVIAINEMAKGKWFIVEFTSFTAMATNFLIILHSICYILFRILILKSNTLEFIWNRTLIDHVDYVSFMR